MKATELMIGDWVYCFDPDEPDDKQINKVSAIRLEFNEGAIKFEQFSDWFEDGWFAPIPLTAEILEKNGFEKRNDEYVIGLELFRFNNTYVKMHNTYPCVLYDDFGEEVKELSVGRADSTRIRFEHRPVFYVHELQHALRLCGLVELADNFKI